MKFWPAVEKDPFRVFFPLGMLMAIAGVLPWTTQLFAAGSYPRDLHRVLMIDGFLLSFVAGFLLTAITRFTGTHYATRGEVTVVFCAVLGAGAGAFFPSQAGSFLFACMAIMLVGAFAVRRFRRKTSNPPYTFIFIGVGLALWLVSNALLFLQALGVPLGAAEGIARDLFSNGAIMSLVLGVGGRLLPGILGWEEIVVAQRSRYEAPKPYLGVIPQDVWFAMALFLASFALLPVFGQRWCLLLRGLVTLYFGAAYWRIHRFPKVKSYLTWALWGSAWFLVLGYFLPVIWPAATVHALHLGFIGGFSLVTLLISMRVTFAHGQAGVAIEKSLPAIAGCAGLVVLAALVRVTAVLWPQTYLFHLGCAAAVWLLGLLVWGWAVLRRGQIFRDLA